MNKTEIDSLPELLTPGQAQTMLGVEERTLTKIRRACPDVARKIPGMAQWRYVKARLLQVSGLIPEEKSVDQLST